MQAFSHISPHIWPHHPHSGTNGKHPMCLAYLRDSQVLGPCDPRQVSLWGEDFPDAQLWKDVLQAVVSGDGELGQGEFDHPENGERNVRVTELCVPLKPHCSQSSCTHSPLTGKNSLYIRAYMTWFCFSCCINYPITLDRQWRRMLKRNPTLAQNWE